MSISTPSLPRARSVCGALVLLGALLLTGGNVLAQSAAQPQAKPPAKSQAPQNKLSEADEKALRSYVLVPETVNHVLDLAADARQQKIKSNASKDAHSIDAWAKGLESDPKAKPLLAKHQISARDYVMTMIATMRAIYAVEANAKTPEEAGTNAANVTYAKANKDRIMASLTGKPAKAEGVK